MKAEDFIDDCTKGCSNEADWNYQSSLSATRLYQPWLTPDEALRAVEIAREEVRQEIMKDAVEGIVTDERAYESYEIDEIDITVGYDKDTTPFFVGDKVRIYIFKEDKQ